MSTAGAAPVSLPWWAALPPARVQVACGSRTHRLRWAEGRLTAEDHPDAGEELVLAALGGERSECVSLVESWGTHRDDLAVLAVGPRSAADELTLSREQLADMQPFPGLMFGVRTGPMRVFRTGPMPVPRPWPVPGVPRSRMASGHARALHRAGPQRAAARRAQDRRLELLSLLALGTEFQLRLTGTVAAAWAGADRASASFVAARPALVAALAGRLAPAARSWLGVDPDLVEARLHEDAGWGRLAATAGGGLAAALPARWLASVWPAGLAVVAGHLVVAVREVTWPRATVLAVREPGAEPVILKVRAAADGWVIDSV
jgi:hypothetical protein